MPPLRDTASQTQGYLKERQVRNQLNATLLDNIFKRERARQQNAQFYAGMADKQKEREQRLSIFDKQQDFQAEQSGLNREARSGEAELNREATATSQQKSMDFRSEEGEKSRALTELLAQKSTDRQTARQGVLDSRYEEGRLQKEMDELRKENPGVNVTREMAQERLAGGSISETAEKPLDGVIKKRVSQMTLNELKEKKDKLTDLFFDANNKKKIPLGKEMRAIEGIILHKQKKAYKDITKDDAFAMTQKAKEIGDEDRVADYAKLLTDQKQALSENMGVIENISAGEIEKEIEKENVNFYDDETAEKSIPKIAKQIKDMVKSKGKENFEYINNDQAEAFSEKIATKIMSTFDPDGYGQGNDMDSYNHENRVHYDNVKFELNNYIKDTLLSAIKGTSPKYIFKPLSSYKMESYVPYQIPGLEKMVKGRLLIEDKNKAKK